MKKKLILLFLFLFLFPKNGFCVCSADPNQYTYTTFANAFPSPSAFVPTADIDEYSHLEGYVVGYNWQSLYIKYNCCVIVDYLGGYGSVDAMTSNTMTNAELYSSCQTGLLDYTILSARDTDSDGINDYSEICQLDGDYNNSSVEPEGGNIDEIVPAGADTDSDGIIDTIEDLIGTDKNVSTAMVSLDLTSTTMTSLNPTSEDYAIVLQTGDGSETSPYGYLVLDQWTMPPLEPFGEPYTYTLGDYGEVPEGVDFKLVHVTYSDGQPIYDYNNGDIVSYTATGSIGDNSNNDTWIIDDIEDLEYIGGGTILTEINEDAENNLDNESSSQDAWDSITNPFDGWGSFSPESSTQATVQIDPADIAAGINLSGAAIQTSGTISITEDEDSTLSNSIDDVTSSLSEFGSTSFVADDVLTSDSMNDAFGILSWIEDLYTIPSIGSQSTISINGFEYLDFQFPDLILDFDDYTVVPLIRNLFLFFFYLSCVWVFFRLTRYAWG